MTLIAQARDHLPELIAFRRDLHQHPEMGYQEFRTSAKVAEALQQLGYSVTTGIAKTGVVAELKKGEGPIVALRADMDALPITEETGLEFSSHNLGVMHACGHDVHTTMVLGAARLLKDTPYQGTVRLLFQPAEEGPNDDPEGFSGGRRMVMEGALQGVKAVMGLHVHPSLPVGSINIEAGARMASANSFYITVHGQAAHGGAQPERGVDAIVIAASIIMNAQSIVGRNVAPLQPAVLSFGTVSGGQKENIIADSVNISGTVRGLDNTVFDTVCQRLKDIAVQTAAMYGGTAEVHFHPAYPVTYNDARVVQVLQNSAVKALGKEALVPLEPTMGAEDFSFMANACQGAYAMIGAQTTGNPYGLHHAKIIVNEEVIPVGMAYLAQGALDLLTENIESPERLS